MTKIRLYRIGRKKLPFYRIVVADANTKMNGSYIENIGTYNPNNGTSTVDKNSAVLWLWRGAQPTNVVKSIFTKHNINQLFSEYKLYLKQKSQKLKNKI